MLIGCKGKIMNGRPVMERRYRYSKSTDDLLMRIRKIEGGDKVIRRAIKEDCYCMNVVQQLIALSTAAGELSLLILQDHIEDCAIDAVREQCGEHNIKELMATLRKAMKGDWLKVSRVISANVNLTSDKVTIYNLGG